MAAGVGLLDPDGPRDSITGRPTCIPARQVHSALSFGVLLAGFSVTSPHTIYPDANLPALRAFAAQQDTSLSDRFGA